METERKAEAMALPLDAADSLIRSGDGDAALLYLYLLRTGSVLELPEAARALGCTEGEAAERAKRLRELGIFPNTARPLPQADELPEYPAEELTRRSGEDYAFRSLIGETQQRLGRLLSGAELKTLFGIYDHLGLPPEVILLLINYCSEQYRRMYGENRRPTMRSIEREAYAWVNREIMTLELAEDYIARRQARETDLQRVRGILGISGRALSPTEKRYIESWLEQGFPPETVELAYDRTAANTGALKWKYMDSILRSWSAKGLLRPEDVEKGDRRTPQQKPPAEKSESAGEQLRMEQLLEELRQKE